MYCKECGKKLPDDAMFCDECGTKVEEDVFEETIPYELRFYTYFSKENHNQYELINKFWNEKLEV